MKRLNLVLFRMKHNMKQREMAERLGLSKGHYSNIELGFYDPSYKVMQKLINDGYKNGCYINFMNAMLASPFPTVYICAWDFERQAYETDTPRLTKFEKTRDEEEKVKLQVRIIN